MSYKKPLHLTLLYTVPFLFVLVILMISLMLWSIKKHRTEQLEELLAQGQTLANQIILNIVWHKNQKVYTKTEGKEQINQSTPLTLLPQPDTTKNLSEISRTGGNYSFRIVMPDNLNKNPEILTKEHLEMLKRQGQYGSFIEIENRKYFQYIKPLDPDLTGGYLIVNIPAELSESIHKSKVTREIVSFIIIGIISMTFIIFVSWSFSKRISTDIDRDMEKNRLKAVVELAGATAHEIRQPLAILIGFSDLVRDKIYRGENVDEDLQIIKEQCFRMNDIITKMLNITHYSIKEYTDGIMIFDLDSQKEKHVMN